MIVCDEAGGGPLVTTDRWDELAGASFGRRLLRGPLEAERLHLQIRRYDARDATEVSRRVRERADLDRIVGQLVELYDEVIAEQQDDAAAGLPSELAHAARFLKWWSEQRETL